VHIWVDILTKQWHWHIFRYKLCSIRTAQTCISAWDLA